jgi:hypothetical protein
MLSSLDEECITSWLPRPEFNVHARSTFMPQRPSLHQCWLQRRRGFVWTTSNFRDPNCTATCNAVRPVPMLRCSKSQLEKHSSHEVTLLFPPVIEAHMRGDNPPRERTCVLAPAFKSAWAMPKHEKAIDASSGVIPVARKAGGSLARPVAINLLLRFKSELRTWSSSNDSCTAAKSS